MLGSALPRVVSHSMRSMVTFNVKEEPNVTHSYMHQDAEQTLVS
jgi:hypothetical protein